MKTRWIVALVLALLFLFAIRPRNRTTTDTPNIPVTSTPAASVAMPVPKAAPAEPMPPAKQIVPADPAVPAPPAVPTPPSADAPPPQQGGTLTEVRDEIENIQFALRDYRTSLGENPIGDNAEITKALLGDNLKQVKIPLPPGATVNGEGQMCDRWGKPYFFHQLSGKQMEIHSAGPDREFGTADDLIVK